MTKKEMIDKFWNYEKRGWKCHIELMPEHPYKRWRATINTGDMFIMRHAPRSYLAIEYAMEKLQEEITNEKIRLREISKRSRGNKQATCKAESANAEAEGREVQV